MKTIKRILFGIIFICFALNITNAQQYYHVHQDNVKPSMMNEYEKVAKDFTDACKKHKPATEWLTVSMDDFKYFYVTPVEGFADLAEKPFADMAKSMGDEFGKMFDRFDKCYDSHGDYLIYLNEDLSYMPNGISMAQEDQNYRDYYFIYHTPDNYDKLKDAMMAVKNMFNDKKSDNYYRVYHSAFGNMENYFLVAMSSKDQIDSAQKQEANKEVLGPNRHEVFQKVLSAASNWREATGYIRNDLSYKHE